MIEFALAPDVPAQADCIALLIAGKVFGDFAPEFALLIKAAEASRFSGEVGQIVEGFTERGGRLYRLILAGAQSAEGIDPEGAGAALAARFGKGGGPAHMALIGVGELDEKIVAVATGLRMRSWKGDRYKTRRKTSDEPSLQRITLVTAHPDAARHLVMMEAQAEGVEFARDLIVEPANVLYPEAFVTRCQSVLGPLGVELTVLDEHAMHQLGMGALLGVAQGSARKPRLLALRWDGTDDETSQPIALIGKGVCFDAGGISIKPALGMEEMKWDMGGAGTVAGAILALAKRGARAHVVGVCGLVENMPDGAAQRPGDVVTSMSGRTIEVINTDCEGRMVLADCLTWVQQQYHPELLVDLATLTGSMIVAMGHGYGGLFANDERLASELIDAGNSVRERLWRFPTGQEYDRLLDSAIADIKNTAGRFAGPITAAQFVKRFVNEGTPWAHIDFAGMVWSNAPEARWGAGPTGYGVRLLDEFIRTRCEERAPTAIPA